VSQIGKYSFLIAFADQLEAALTRDHGIDRVSDSVESLRASLDGLIAAGHLAAGQEPGDDDDGVDAEDDDDGYGPPLGGSVPDRGLEGPHPTVVRTLRATGHVPVAPAPGMVLGGGGRKPALLTKGGKRRGKK